MNRTMAKSVWLGILLVLGASWVNAQAPETPAPAPEAPAAPPTLLWEIGVADNNTAEFALGPDQYNRYTGDGFYVVGWSDPKQDWPYVQPGPVDAWAGNLPHVFTILFSLSESPADGECTLRYNLVDIQTKTPPRVAIHINGQRFTGATGLGSGSDESVSGHPEKGKQLKMALSFPVHLLFPGENTITFTTEDGSWMIYDWVGLEAPKGTVLSKRTKPLARMGTPQIPPLLIEKDGALHQVVRVPIRQFGPAQEAVLKLTGQPDVAVSLQNGAQTVEMSIPASEQTTFASLELKAGDMSLGRRDLVILPARKWTVYLMHHTHLDIGYTHVQTEVEQIQWKHVDKALELIQQTADYPVEARFKWLPEGLWAIDSYLKQATPEKRQAFIDAVKAGSIGLDALYGNELTALCRPEELLELTGYARRLSKEYGLNAAPGIIDTAMISDVPGYTWGMVPALAQSGVKYFSIGPNAGHRIGYTLSAWGDKPFYWVSPSGEEKVLCWVVGKAYSWFHSKPFGDGQRLLDYLTELQQGGFPYETVHIRYNIGGDNGPPDPNLPELVKTWNAKYAYPKLVMATTHEAFADFEQRYGESLPRVTGDFTPYWEDGAASSARETGVNRAAAERLVQANTLWALVNPAHYPAAEFQAAWRNVLLYDEHTWGAHNSISEPECDFVKGQWAIKQSFAVDAARQSQELFNRALLSVQAEPAQAAAYLVFNTTSWGRTELVTLSKDWNRPGDRVIGPDGKAAPSQALSNGDLVFLAKNVPPMGSARYTVQAGDAGGKGKAQATATQLTNGVITVAIDPATGAISSLKHKDRAVDLVNTEKGPGLNDYLYVAGQDPKEPQRNGQATITIKEQGPLVASLVVESSAPGCKTLRREIRLVSEIDYVEINNILDKENVYEKEGVHLGFPFQVPDGVVRMDIPFAVVRPETEQMEGACKNYFTVQRWVDVSNEQYGVTLATLDAPLIEIGAITNDARIVGWIKSLAPSTTIYSYVMNNYWETNYKASQDGPTGFRYALRPHAGYDAGAAQRFGTALSQPLAVIPVGADTKASPARVKIAPEGVVATVLKPSDDGKALILRLFNTSGQAQAVTVQWSDPQPQAVQRSNVSEDPGEPIGEKFEMVPWQILTLRAPL